MKLKFLDAISEAWTKRIVVALRVLIGSVFVFSGLVKGIDVWGLFYKIQDYLVAFGWDSLLPYTNVATSVIPVYEFLFGFFLIIGTFRKWTVILLLSLMGFMLPLSLYIAIFEPVADCGCFGDAVVVPNTTTFVKNIFLTIGLVFLLIKNRTVKSVYFSVNQWLTVVIPFVFLIVVMLLGYFIQPLVDFRPYKMGTSLTNVSIEGDDTEFVFVYEKEGERQEFGLDELPEDTAWTFVDRREVSRQTEPDSVNVVSFYDNRGELVEEDLLATGEVALLLVPDIDRVNVASTFDINELHAVSNDFGVKTFCLTSGTEKEIKKWQELSLSDYPIFTMDDTVLKSIARGNPAVVRLSEGKIIWKVTIECIDSEDLYYSSSCTEVTIMQNGGKVLAFLAGIAVLLLGLLYLANQTPVLINLGIKWSRNRKDKNSKEGKKEVVEE